ncbi:DUF3809 domain-containing protein [Deinococcus radiopugnans]|uniref:DUF3809 domain-containing protein n=1 Tax=Deinococcus radiopugnans ATCC 19172 TaxID=585398 RepID=A0A5C4Y168_9DEIO|nr:DUF3809 domain-containing protein [Deinococcus radiopugnans]MBB6017817.1 hypothetical protein [Deinococcus radiopugnans ATCC 19172]TNM69547.1 DUF3809 domain-containing protein [Deinococcus radiopugnans ATCC 19172]
MIIEAGRHFTLQAPGSAAATLAFVRDPARALSRLHFLRGLNVEGHEVRGELLVPLPVLGEADLPFVCVLAHTPDGATLTPRPIEGERAWVEVTGQAQVLEGAQAARSGETVVEVAFNFLFRAHLATPDAQGWGGAAFEKMVRAAAGRTLDRVTQELPEGLREALEAG